MPGVVDVWTAAELAVPAHHGFVKIHDDFLRPPLAVDRVRFVGEAYAVVFAETLQQAVDAAETVFAEIEPLPAVTDPEAALADGAPLLFPARRDDNVAVSDTPDEPLDLEASRTSSCVAATSTSASPSPRWNRTAAPPRSQRMDASRSGRPTSSRTWSWLSSPARWASRPIRSASSRLRSVADSAARPGCRPSTRWSQPRRDGSGDRSCGSRRAARTCRPRTTAAARCSTPSSAAAATERSPVCAFDSSATAAPTQVSVRPFRVAPDG